MARIEIYLDDIDDTDFEITVRDVHDGDVEIEVGDECKLVMTWEQLDRLQRELRDWYGAGDD